MTVKIVKVTPKQGNAFSYNLVRRPKRRTLSIVIRPDNTIDVLAPARMQTTLIEQFVDSKSAWITRKLEFNAKTRALYIPKTFIADELFHLLGKPYRLKVSSGKRSVALSGETLCVSLPASTATERQPEVIKKLIEKWYRQQAERDFSERAEAFTAVVGKGAASIAVKGYKSRWGSCHLDGRIYFNWRLIMAPAWVIDYVVLHELCHLVHHNHSRHYWQLVASIMPDYHKAKSWLKINGTTLSL